MSLDGFGYQIDHLEGLLVVMSVSDGMLAVMSKEIIISEILRQMQEPTLYKFHINKKNMNNKDNKN